MQPMSGDIIKYDISDEELAKRHAIFDSIRVNISNSLEHWFKKGYEEHRFFKDEPRIGSAGKLQYFQDCLDVKWSDDRDTLAGAILKAIQQSGSNVRRLREGMPAHMPVMRAAFRQMALNPGKDYIKDILTECGNVLVIVRFPMDRQVQYVNICWTFEAIVSERTDATAECLSDVCGLAEGLKPA